MCLEEICVVWLPLLARLGISLLPSAVTPLSLERKRGKEQEKSQAAYYGLGGILSLLSALCAWGSSLPLPSKMPVLLNQGTPKLVFTHLGKNGSREWYFAMSPPSLTLQAWDAGGWVIADRAGVGLQEQRPKQGRASGGWMRWSWYWGWLSACTRRLHNLMYITAGSDRFIFIISYFNTSLKHEERNPFYFGVNQNTWGSGLTELAVLL